MLVPDNKLDLSIRVDAFQMKRDENPEGKGHEWLLSL